jgi:deazaflavin-dependent oxidoreductase (nitroreductase family)
MNPMRWTAVKLGGQPWLSKYSRLIVGSDKLLQRLTRGRVTIMMATGLKELVLQVPGRKSGILRTTPLLCVPHGDGWLVVGSNWGGAEPPAWAGNLLAAEEPLVTFKGRTVAADARLVVGGSGARRYLGRAGQGVAELPEVRRAHRPRAAGLLAHPAVGHGSSV